MSTIGADDEQAIPGAYYIAVQLADPRGASGAPVPVNLDVSVQGKAEQGPAYVGGGIRDGRASPAPAADDEESSSLVSGAGPLHGGPPQQGPHGPANPPQGPPPPPHP